MTVHFDATYYNTRIAARRPGPYRMTHSPGSKLLATAAEPAASLELLYRRHYGWLLRQMRKRFGPDQAEDLVQETYLRAAAYQGSEVQHPRSLLIQIAIRVAIDLDRRRRARVPLDGGNEADAHTQEEQADAFALKQVILSLPEGVKQTFLLSRFGGLSYQEIAVRSGVSVKTVEWRMSKALKICSTKLRG